MAFTEKDTNIKDAVFFFFFNLQKREMKNFVFNVLFKPEQKPNSWSLITCS